MAGDEPNKEGSDTMTASRRQFILSLSSFAAASTMLPLSALAGRFEPPLYPPVDLSYFDKPIASGSAAIRFGYAAITWGGDDLTAIKEVSELGFPGIQLRSNLLKTYGDKPAAIKEILQQHKLQFVALSGGGPSGGSDYDEAQVIDTQVKQATFLRDAGGLYLQMTDSARPKAGKPAAEDFKKLARTLTEVGKRIADLGIQLGYHNHMNSLGEAPDEVDRIMDAVDPRYVKLELDIAHYAQGGGDPAKAIRKYGDRILFLHIKDVESVTPSDNQKNTYRFVELGRGRVDLPAVFAALKAVKFRGWAIIELDNVPDKSGTPKASAMISKKYVEEKLKLKI
jgi:inosose dehydratase